MHANFYGFPHRGGPSRTSPDPVERAIFDEFEAYPFSDDTDFTAGLPTVIAAIRATKRTAAQIDEMIGRAQWFYFTRLKGVDLSWESYANHASSRELRGGIDRSEPAPGTFTPHNVPARPRDALAALNNLAEAKRMMSRPQEGDPYVASRAGEAMSFAMLCRLISEGRAAEVSGVEQIPEGLNVSIQTSMPSRRRTHF